MPRTGVGTSGALFMPKDGTNRIPHGPNWLIRNDLGNEKMNPAHLHLILNHFPIAGMLFAMPILLVAWWRKSDVLGQIGMLIVVLAGLITIPVFLTGEPTEEMIEHLPCISEKLIEVHEEMAEKAIWVVGAASLTALASLVYALLRKSFPMKAIPPVMILALCSLGVLAWTNNLGGEISHPEIKKNVTPSVQLQSEGNEIEDKD